MSTWPQWTWIVLIGIGILQALAKDGEPKTSKHCFGSSLAAAMFSGWILWMGGFFAPLGW